MATRIISANGVYDLSNVTNAKDLAEEIEFLKVSLKKEATELETHIRKLPQHFVKSTAESLLPSFLNKLIANGTWKLLLSSAAMFANPFSGKFSFKKNIVGSAKKLGLITLVKSAFSLWSSKRIAKHKPVAQISKPTLITSLKTKNFKKS
ncbi:MAG: hypothetical protein ABJA35_01625 [Parafilimonas sp.]